MSELKFDRERFDRGEMPTRTRDGHKVLHVHDSGIDCEYPISAWLEGADYPSAFSADGRCGSPRIAKYDLVHEPNTRKVRVAVVQRPAHSQYPPFVYSMSEPETPLFDKHMKELQSNGCHVQIITVEVPA